MLNAIYKYEEASNVFYLQFSNTLTLWPDYKEVNATYHLENAIRKAYGTSQDAQKTNPKLADLKFQIKVSDARNDYLKITAMAFVQFIKGMGIPVTHILTEGF